MAGFREFLITTEDWPSHGIEALSERLETCLTDAATLKNDRALMCADPLTSIAFAEILAHIACGGKLAVAGNDPQKRFKFFDQLFFLLPHDLFDSQQWCTYADAMGTDREDLVGLASSLVPEKKSFMGLLKKRIGLAYREGPRMVDAVSGTTRGARNNSGKKTKFSRVYEEFLSGGILKPYPPKDSLSVVLKLIAAQSHNRHLDLEDLAGKISREDISELMHLVRRQGHGQR